MRFCIFSYIIFLVVEKTQQTDRQTDIFYGSGCKGLRTSDFDVEVLPTSDQHGADGEDLLRVRVGRNVAKAHTGQTAQGKVE